MKKLILITLSLTSLQSFALSYNCNYTVLDQGTPAKTGAMKIDISRRKITSDIFTYDYRKSECELATQPGGILYLSCDSAGVEYAVIASPGENPRKHVGIAAFNIGSDPEATVSLECTKR